MVEVPGNRLVDLFLLGKKYGDKDSLLRSPAIPIESSTIAGKKEQVNEQQLPMQVAIENERL